MPESTNGIGTIFYGKRDFRPDGSYVTTEWLIVLWIPILPLRSARILDIGEGEHRLSTIRSLAYLEIEEQNLSSRQVWSTYLYIVSCVASYALIFFPIMGLGLPLFVVILLLPTILRRRSKKRISIVLHQSAVNSDH